MQKHKNTTEDLLVEKAREAVHSVVQIRLEGYDQDYLNALLDPRQFRSTDWSGTGFFIQIDGEDGYILTNAHVAINATKIHIKSMLTSEEVFQVELLGLVKSGEPDVALLRLLPEEKKRFTEICGCPIPNLKLSDSDLLQRGEMVKAIGYPFGMGEPHVSGGEISNLVPGDTYLCERLVTDAAINPGNSGGPSITVEGVIGLNTSIIDGANNIGFITPISYVSHLLPALKNGGKILTSHLGADLQPNSPQNSKFLGQEKVEGIILSQIYDGSFLAQAGLKNKDIVLSINKFNFDRYGNIVDTKLHHKRNIFDVIRRALPGEEILIRVFRQGQVLSIKTKAQPFTGFGVQRDPLCAERKFLNFSGMIIQELSIELINSLSITLGVNFWSEIPATSFSKQQLFVISNVETDSTADHLFLSEGDLVTSINNQDITSLNQLCERINQFIEEKKDIILECSRGSFGVFKTDDLSPLQIESVQNKIT